MPVNGINFLYRKVKAFRLESLNQENLGVVSIDGENYQSDIIQGRIMPQILRVFSFWYIMRVFTLFELCYLFKG